MNDQSFNWLSAEVAESAVNREPVLRCVSVSDSICASLHPSLIITARCWSDVCSCPSLVIVSSLVPVSVGLWSLLAPPTRISAFWLVCLSVRIMGSVCGWISWHLIQVTFHPGVLINEIQWFIEICINQWQQVSYFLILGWNMTNWFWVSLLCRWRLSLWKWIFIDRCRSKL